MTAWQEEGASAAPSGGAFLTRCYLPFFPASFFRLT
jgi:hypothetical protein